MDVIAQDTCERDTKGIWIPIEIWEDRSLTMFEVVLLAEIDSLDHGKGCYKSTDLLAARMRCSIGNVYNVISSLKKRGYLKIVWRSPNRRGLRTCYSRHGKSSNAEMRRVEVVSCKNETASNGKMRRNIKDTNKRTNITARQNGETVAVGNFGINGEHQIDEGSPSFKLVKRYHKFSTAKKFHIRSIHPITRKTTYALGAGVGGWTRRTLQNWQACCEALLEQHQYKKVKRVMLWYFEHCEDEWLPAMCRTMPTFCERFDGIEKAWRRKNKNQETEDDSPAPRITYE